jgi:uncharacterized membrane protein SpoIIM required for sporulation
MNADEFISRKRSAWERLTHLLDHAGASMTALSAEELYEIGQLYRQVTSDLAVARRDFPQHQLVNYLNGLVARSHGAIYRDHSGGWERIRTFFLHSFPHTFRTTFGFTFAAMLMLMLPALTAFWLTFRDPTLASALVPGSEAIVDAVQEGNEWWQRINEEGRSRAAAEIMTNNIAVTFRAFAGGVVFGIYTFYILVFNGLLLGVVAGAAQRFGFADNLWGFVIAHAVVEFSVIFIAGGAGLQLGWALLRPGLHSRRGALVLAARRAVILLLGCVPLLAIAGMIEGFISPSALPFAVKVAVALGSGLALYTYLFGTSRSQTSVTSPPDPLPTGSSRRPAQTPDIVPRSRR